MILHVIAADLTAAWRSQMETSCTACWFLECWYMLFMFSPHISYALSKKKHRDWIMKSTDYWFLLPSPIPVSCFPVWKKEFLYDCNFVQ